MKDGRTHLADKAKHAVDLETGAVVGVTVQAPDTGDTTSMVETLIAAAEQIEAVQPEGPGIEEVVGDKGYHSNRTMTDLKALGLRSYISEPDQGRRCWKGRSKARDAVYANRRRVRGARGRRLLRCREELLERPFAHVCETGGMRRVHLREHPNILKRLLVQFAGCNLGLLLRQLIRRGHAAEPSGPGYGRILGSLPVVGRPVGPSAASLYVLQADFGQDRLVTAPLSLPPLPMNLETSTSGCKAIYGAGTDLADQWANDRRAELNAGRLCAVVAALRIHVETTPEARKCIHFVFANRHRMRYTQFRARGLCVSSGVVEAGCKQLGARLKCAGTRWTFAGANAIIALRCCILSGRFEDFWERRAANAA